MCSNAARVFVHESIFDKFLKKCVEATERLRIGNTMDGRTQIGALISDGHLEKVSGFIERAVKEVIVLVIMLLFCVRKLLKIG